MDKRIFSLLLLAVVLFWSNLRPAHALVVYDPSNFKQNTVTALKSVVTAASTAGSFALSLAQKIANTIGAQALLINKLLALYAVQQSTALIIGSGNKSTIIRDFANYLYVSPTQKALLQMDIFFNTVSRGRLSSLNYEGIGPNYDAYLVTQAKRSIQGQPFITNIQSQTTDPRNMFADKNMKGIMSFFQCANNPYCYTLVATEQYKKEFTKAQEIAKSENVNGFIPTKANGRITQPAAIAQNALMQIDQLGTQLIMNAQDNNDASISGITQVWEGAGISVAARLANYGISDEAGRAAIRNRNDQFPFSLSYSSSGGLGISAGGVVVNTGLGQYNDSVRIGNTTACLSASIDGTGNTYVYINGVRTQCPRPSGTTLVAPSITVVLPTITCTNATACNNACRILPGCSGTLSCINNRCTK